ncbi:hypothetical protein [Fredinandcohnia quinoae]|uniref:Uncharacterized protein n=1 Tax=Fredinandcohnia quinoae TaxID=2918902 RepID=A0AAW5ECZ8_9BACI|nr:hypothetical protein [Fredinandcohnia sp. SECRCQ15]MCH1627033.1 hypothetical protein [Fredinandcohnia sp. SECRCQ15]
MPRVFVHFTFIFFTLTAFSGTLMRLFTIQPSTAIPYTNILHGHSHLAILGWAFLGGFVIYLLIFWKSIQKKRQATTITITLFITSAIMFAAFLYQGYDVFSIIMSTVHIFIEYWAIRFIYRHLKAQNNVPKSGKRFIYASLIALLISSMGPFSLGYIAANGLKDTYFFDLAIYFYLHFQYNGWLYLFLMGVFIMIIDSKKIPFQDSLLKIGFWLYFLALFPSYFLSILWIDLGGYVQILAVIGSIGQWFGIAFVLLAFKRMWKRLWKQYSKLTITCLWITFLLLFFKSTMELGLISPKLANLIYDTRSIVIGYLHFTLLGFISTFILSQYQMLNILKDYRLTIYGFVLFFIGFFLNEGLLFGQGLLEWLNLSGIPYFANGLFIASVLLLTGIVLLWISFAADRKNAR